jgi:4-oxalocrotonate tautomerase
MPFINVQTIKGIMTEAEKTTLLDKITDLVVEIEGKGNPQFRSDVWVRIDEHEPESWSLGGRKPTRAYIESVFGNNR